MGDTNLLFSEKFNVIDIDCDNSVGENVNRIHCEGELSKSDMLLDVFSPMFKVTVGQTLDIQLVKEIQDPRLEFADNGDPIPLVDPLDTSEILEEFYEFEYIVHGKIYSIEDKVIDGEPIIAMYASFGGLLLRLQLPLTIAICWVIDSNLFLLAKHYRPQTRATAPLPITHHHESKKSKEKKIVCKLEPESS